MDINILTVFILAIFVGFEIITKVPPTLHTPLMSGSNAISGIAIVGAIISTIHIPIISPSRMPISTDSHLIPTASNGLIKQSTMIL